MLSNLIALVKGRVTVEITGADVERYLSACVRKGVELREITRLTHECVRAETGLDGYFIMRRMARRAMCKLRVTQKRGAPFVARRLEKRWGLMLGLALCIFSLWYLTGFLWTVEITGCENVSQIELLHLLEKNGLKTGARLSDISPMQIKNSVLLETDELSFLSVNLMGTHAQVIVRERAPAVEIVPSDAPCDIVSDKTGVIARLRVRQGAARVAVGQTLMPGDLIASGTLTSALGETRLVHADAEADLRIWYNKRRILPIEVLAPRETGERAVRRALMIGGRRINLYMIESEPFACYYKEVERTALTLGDSFRVPVMLITETYIELETSSAEIGSAEASALLEARMRESLVLEHEGAEIVSLRFEMDRQDGAYIAWVQAECIETAGIEKLIQ